MFHVKHSDNFGLYLDDIIEKISAGFRVDNFPPCLLVPTANRFPDQAVFVLDDNIFDSSTVGALENKSGLFFLPPKGQNSHSPGGFFSDYNSLVKEFFSFLSTGSFKNVSLVCASSSLNQKMIVDKKESVFVVDKNTRFNSLVSVLANMGYEQVDVVVEQCSFAVRGGLIDVFPVESKHPFRVVFFGDTTTIYSFSPCSQLTVGHVGSFNVSTLLFEEEKSKTLREYFSNGWNFITFDGESMVSKEGGVGVSRLPVSVVNVNEKWKSANEPYNVLYEACLVDSGVLFDKVNLFLPDWCNPCFSSDRKETRPTKQSLEDFDVSIGDFLVHEDFGIGKYLGLFVGDGDEGVVLGFECGGRVSVDSSCLYKVSFYAPKHQPVNINSLNKQHVWKRKKNAVEKDASKIVSDLVCYYAQRQSVVRAPYSVDNELLGLFLQEFPFRETVDQNNCWKEILGDLLSEKPMDRLLCGDVGFGKTEIAIRASFVAVLSGIKVAVLAPTTILANQLYGSFSNRLGGFGVNVGVVSRYKTKKECEKILLGFVEDRIDVLVGTHKLLYDDVVFNEVGLFVVDEEHKFGVKQKEKISNLKNNVDVLSMSATPIPRTMQMSVSGIRNTSLLNTPPSSRLPINTRIYFYNVDIIKSAISRELSRGGQVFFVHNNVGSLNGIVREISNLFPGVRVECVHGQESSGVAEKKMIDFINNDIKVLVCTSIIESGLDISNANTIIINNSHLFGLSQLYQIRGRVGRGARQGFALLLVPKKATLTEDAFSRLKTIEKNSSLGSGFVVAQKDLEIRGGGSLLGHNQSGGGVVGLELYSRFINEAVANIEGVNVGIFDPRNIYINLFKNNYIPEEYVSVERLRLGFYKQMSSQTEKESLVSLFNSVVNRFGSAPVSFINFYHTLLLKFYCFDVSVVKIVKQKQVVSVSFNGGVLKHGVDTVFKQVSLFFGKLEIPYWFNTKTEGVLALSFEYTKDKDIATFLMGFFDKLCSVLNHKK